MTSRLHQHCTWDGARGVYMVVGTYCGPYSHEAYLTLVETKQDEETGTWCPDCAYPVIMATEDELTFIGEDSEIYNK
jgi:hypothetical protein